MADEKNIEMANTEIADEEMADVAGGLFNHFYDENGKKHTYLTKARRDKAQKKYEEKKTAETIAKYDKMIDNTALTEDQRNIALIKGRTLYQNKKAGINNFTYKHKKEYAGVVKNRSLK